MTVTPAPAAQAVSAQTAARAVRVVLWATLAGAALAIGYFTVGGAFAQLSDATALLAGAALVPIVVHVWQRTRPDHRRVAAASLVVGLVAATLIVVSSLLLIFSESGIALLGGRGALVGQFMGMAAQGGWLLTIAALARRTGLFSPRTAAAAAVAGLCYAIVGIGEPLTGFRQLLMYACGGVALIALGLWAVWAARDLEARRPMGAAGTDSSEWRL